MYKILVCDAKTGIDWEVDAEKELSADEHEFIKNFYPAIYHNDIECYLWAFDAKMPGGRWLENIRFSNNLKKATAYIF